VGLSARTKGTGREELKLLLLSKVSQLQFHDHVSYDLWGGSIRFNKLPSKLTAIGMNGSRFQKDFADESNSARVLPQSSSEKLRNLRLSARNIRRPRKELKDI